MKSMKNGRAGSLVAPRDGKTNHIFGTVKVGERGQVVIPKEAREIFDIRPGDMLFVLGDEERGIALIKAEILQEFAEKILEKSGKDRGQ
jgi:AbrB family looped-hinge helix DNA binding protein